MKRGHKFGGGIHVRAMTSINAVHNYVMWNISYLLRVGFVPSMTDLIHNTCILCDQCSFLLCIVSKIVTADESVEGLPINRPCRLLYIYIYIYLAVVLRPYHICVIRGLQQAPGQKTPGLSNLGSHHTYMKCDPFSCKLGSTLAR